MLVENTYKQMTLTKCDVVNYALVFPRFSGHTEEFQLIRELMEVCYAEGRGAQVF